MINYKLQKKNGTWLLNYSEEYTVTKKDKILLAIVVVCLILSCIN